MNGRSLTLSAKIIILLLLCISFVMLAGTGVSYILRRSALLAERNQQCAIAVERIATTMANPLWNLDLEQMREIAREELKNTGFIRLTVVNPTDEILLDESGVPPASGWFGMLHNDQHTVWRHITWRGTHKLGSVGLYFDNRYIYDKLVQILIWSAVQGVVLMLVTCTVLYIALSTVLLRHLKPVLKAAEEFGAGNLTNRITVSSQDELGRLADTFNLMADGIEERIAQLKEAEAKYRRLFESIQDAFYRTDKEGTLILVSPSFSAVLGYDSEAVLGRSALELFVDSDESAAFLDALKNSGHTDDALVYLKKADGTPVIISTSSHYYYDEQGNTLGVEGLFRDVTDRIDSFREIEQLKDSLSAVIDSLPSLIFTVDRDGTVNLWNSAAASFTGISAATAHGTAMTELLPQFASHLQEVQQVIDRQYSRRIDKFLVFDGTEQHFYEILITPYTRSGSQGAVIRIDETTEKLRVEEIMIQTEKMMMIGGLAAGMAHEINNPLGAIMQSAQNIVRRVSTDIPANHDTARQLGIPLDVIREYMTQRGILGFIDHIRESGARAAKIITSMMKFSRKSESRSEEANLVEVLEQTIELASNDYDLKKKYDFRHIELIREFQEDLPPVAITVLEIEQVLLNIIKNAAQAMAELEGEHIPRLTFRLRRKGDFAVIEIEDNGPGMDEVTQNRVFEPFFTTKEVGVGTGLGLSVSYTIITTNHHGSFKVRSRPGTGACFIITLPIRGRS